MPEIQRLKAGDHQLEYVWHGPPPAQAPTLVFLPEASGCAVTLSVPVAQQRHKHILRNV